MPTGRFIGQPMIYTVNCEVKQRIHKNCCRWCGTRPQEHKPASSAPLRAAAVCEQTAPCSQAQLAAMQKSFFCPLPPYRLYRQNQAKSRSLSLRLRCINAPAPVRLSFHLDCVNPPCQCERAGMPRQSAVFCVYTAPKCQHQCARPTRQAATTSFWFPLPCRRCTRRLSPRP